MFSVIGVVKGFFKRKLHKVKKETKKAQGEAEKELIKSGEVSPMEAKIKAKEAPNVVINLLKKAKLKAKVMMLTVLEHILRIIKWFIGFLIATFGTVGCCVILFVFVLMIVRNGLIHMDFGIISDSTVNVEVVEDDCIQGGQALSSTGYDLDAIGQLMGTLTDYEKNLYRTLALYNEILSDTSVISNPTNINTVISKLGKDNVVKFLYCFTATETGMRFDNGQKNILEYPSTLQKNSYGYAFLGLHYNNSFDGKYQYNGRSNGSGVQFLTESFVTSWKSKYSPKETPIYDNNYVPYGVATQVGAYSGSYLGSHFSNVATNLPAIMDAYNIQANREQLIAFAQLFAGSASYHSGASSRSISTNLFSLWCALWSVTSETDSQRSFDNIKIVYDNAYDEGTARDYIVGSGGGNSDTVYVKGQNKPGYFEINGKAISSTLWEYVALNCSNPEYFKQTAQVWIDEYSGSTLILNGHYGLISYLVGNKIVEDLGGSIPISTGGNRGDCISNYPDVQVGEYKNTEGQPQGIWNAFGYTKTTMDIINEIEVGKPWGAQDGSTMTEKAKTRIKGFIEHMGVTKHASNGTATCWRKELADRVLTETKFKAPFYHQSSCESWGSVKSGTSINNPSSESTFQYNGCHTFAVAYALSVTQGRLINPPEALVIGWYGGLWGDGMGGDYYVGEFIKNMNLNGKTISDDAVNGKKEVDEILDKNGVIVTYLSDPFSSGDCHWVCITERISEGGTDKYKIWTSTQIDQMFKTYPFDFLYEHRVKGNWLRMGLMP